MQISRIISKVQGEFRLRIEEKELPDRVEEFVGYIIEHFPNANIYITMSKKALGIHNHSFNTLFKQHVGCTPVQMLQTLRGTLAMQCLHERDVQIKNIPSFCGFRTYRAFARRIKILTGFSPQNARSNEPSSNVESKDAVATEIEKC